MFRAFLALALLLPVAARAQAPAPPVMLAADAEARWTPFTLTPGDQIRFRLLLDGKPVEALLDTGVSLSALSKRYAEAEKMAVTPAGKAVVIGGEAPAGLAPVTSLVIGPATRIGGQVAVVDLPEALIGGGRAVQMLVGGDLLKGYAVDIDYSGRRFRLLPTGRMPFTGATVPLVTFPRWNLIAATVTLGARRVAPVLVDTGDGSGVTVAAAEWRAAGLTAVPTTSGLIAGPIGPVTSTLAIVPELRLGDLPVRNAEVRVEPAGGFSETIGAAGRIGSGLLQNYRVLLDPTAGRMVLSPGPTADRPPVRITSGLLLGLVKDRFRVLHVMANGPAAAAGWKAGEEICRVDGAAVDLAYVRSPAAGWVAGAPGRVVRLTLCDGTERALTLAAFY